MSTGVGWNELICKTGNKILISAVSMFSIWVCSSKTLQGMDLAYSAQLFSHPPPCGGAIICFITIPIVFQLG